ncbi:MAG TPA: hypothetical protein VFX58_09255 [Chitinophagaceae bacterium]|nr:hypothetical protein [Chitinophagaceae bacterium]
MHFEANHVYHVYNRGNDKSPIFFNEKNYLFIIEKIRKEWQMLCDVLCYCLMPNHFHFMLFVKPEACEKLVPGDQPSHLQKLSKKIGNTLSSYTRAIHKQNNTRGNLFQKKTKAKCLTDIPFENNRFRVTDYLIQCINYIHLNPLKAGLVNCLADWPFSSWPEYYYNKEGGLCNKQRMFAILGVNEIMPGPNENFLFNSAILKDIW